MNDRLDNVLEFCRDGIFSDSDHDGVFGPAERHVDFERDPFTGRITALIDPRGNRVEYGYDDGNLISVKDRAAVALDPDGPATSFVYDDPNRPHFLTRIDDPLGRDALEIQYNPEGRVETLTDADGQSLTQTYNAAARTQTTTDDESLATTTLEFNDLGDVVRVDDAENGTTLRTFGTGEDRRFLQSETRVIGQADDPSNNETDDLTTTYTHDAFGNVEEITDPADRTTYLTYNYRLRRLQPADRDRPGIDHLAGRPDVLLFLRPRIRPAALHDRPGHQRHRLLLRGPRPADQGPRQPRRRRLESRRLGCSGGRSAPGAGDDLRVRRLRRRHRDDRPRHRGRRRPGDHPLVPVRRERQPDPRRAALGRPGRPAHRPDRPHHQRVRPQRPAHRDPRGDRHPRRPGRSRRPPDRRRPVPAGLRRTQPRLAHRRRPGQRLGDDLRRRGLAIRNIDLASDGTVDTISHTYYDAQGRPVFSDDTHRPGRNADGTAIAYDNPDQPGQPTDGTKTVYDKLGRVVETQRRRDVVLTVGTDPGNGAPEAQVVSEGTLLSKTVTQYDDAGRVPRSIRSTYDASGTTVVDAVANETDFDDAGMATEGRVIINYGMANQTVAATTSSEYDSAGRLTLATDALGHATRTHYDDVGRPWKTTYHDLTFTRTAYDRRGNRVAQTDQAGITTELRIRPLRQPRRRRPAAGPRPRGTAPEA